MVARLVSTATSISTNRGSSSSTMDLSCKLVTLVAFLVSVASYALWLYMELHTPIAIFTFMWGGVFAILFAALL